MPYYSTLKTLVVSSIHFFNKLITLENPAMLLILITIIIKIFIFIQQMLSSLPKAHKSILTQHRNPQNLIIRLS